MIVVIDADYNEERRSAHAAGVLAESILADRALRTVGAFVGDVGDYIPGQFYRRELKCVEAVMELLKTEEIELIVVDGYADSGTEEKALGTFVHEKYGVPVIGIAKNRYKKCAVPDTEVSRCGCKKPLFVTSKGMDHATAKAWVAKMYGEYRLPLLVKLADKAARDRTLVTEEKKENKMRMETERLIITDFTPDMAEAVHRNSLDEDNRRFVPDEVFETVDDARGTIEFLIGQYGGTEGPFVHPVLLKSGENIGYVQLVFIGDGWELGYHIAKEYTGKGYATEASRAFLPAMAEKMGLSEIIGICLAENKASVRVMEKLGFEPVFRGVGPYQGEQREIVRNIWRAGKEGEANGA